MATLRTSALGAAHRGETTYEEVLRATHIDDVSGPRCPSCARVLADDMIACPWDGTPVGQNRCTGCDRPMDPQWQMCPWCRTAAANPPPVETAAVTRLPRLLVIDDDPSVCSFITTALTGAAEVVTVGTAEGGLAAVGEQEFDGALIDNVLPDLMGIELIRLLRADPRTLTLPLVLFTGSENPDLERDARRAGADDYLRKPVEPALLEERVLELMRSSARPG
jgi:CheY-like chemotaxis protein